MYDLRLKTFICAAEQGSFAKTAEALYITATAVMKQINALEEECGITLFDRTNRGLQLTEAGKSFFDDAKYIIDYSQKALAKAKEVDSRHKQKTIRVGTSIMTPAKCILDVWPEIQKYEPDLKIELIPFDNTPQNSVEILKNLGSVIDVVAGIYDEDFLKERQCSAEYLYDRKILLAVPVNHALAQKQKLTIADLKGETVLTVKKGWNKFIDELRANLIDNGAEVADFEMFNINAFNQAVKDNVPITAFGGLEDVHPLLKVMEVEWHYSIPYGILYSQNPTKLIRKFVDIIHKMDIK